MVIGIVEVVGMVVVKVVVVVAFVVVGGVVNVDVRCRIVILYPGISGQEVGEEC